MSVQYFLVDKKNKAFYQLGNAGSWFIVETNLEKDFFYNLELLIEFLKEEIYHLNDNWLTEENKNYLNNEIETRIGPDLFDFAKNCNSSDLQIISDMSDDLWIIKCIGYRCVGTRFYEKKSKEYIEEIEILNRHLLKSDFNSKMYSLEQAKKYINYDKYE